MIWQMLYDDLPMDFFNLNMNDWIFHIISAPNAQNLLIAYWFIWLSKNAEIFCDEVWPAWLVSQPISRRDDESKINK